MSTILDTKASYRGDQDAVQAIVVLADENGNSLHDDIATARVELRYHEGVVATQSFTSEAYIYPTAGGGDLGEFRLCFFHFPLQRELEVAVMVTLTTGEDLHVVRPVLLEREPDSTVNFSNPLLDNRVPVTWPKQQGIDYERSQP